MMRTEQGSRISALYRPVGLLGLALIFAAIGIPYLLHALGVEPSLLSDEWLGKCPYRASKRGLACNLPAYASATMLGVGCFFSLLALALILQAISTRWAEVARFAGMLGHVGLGYASLSYLFRPSSPNLQGDRNFGLLAGFVSAYCLICLAFYTLFYVYRRKKSGTDNTNG